MATRRSCSSATPDQALYEPSASIGTGSQLRASLQNRGLAQQERGEDSQDSAGSLVTITWTSLKTDLISSLNVTESARQNKKKSLQKTWLLEIAGWYLQ